MTALVRLADICVFVSPHVQYDGGVSHSQANHSIQEYLSVHITFPLGFT